MTDDKNNEQTEQAEVQPKVVIRLVIPGPRPGEPIIQEIIDPEIKGTVTTGTFRNRKRTTVLKI